MRRRWHRRVSRDLRVILRVIKRDGGLVRRLPYDGRRHCCVLHIFATECHEDLLRPGMMIMMVGENALPEDNELLLARLLIVGWQ